MVSFTLKQCTYFRAVAECGGISQASRALNISQPSVSAAIDKLEAITGLTLFHRHHARGLTLTMQGRLFLEQVKALETAAERVGTEARTLAREVAGELRLGVFWTLAPFYLPKLIRGFQIETPGVTVRPSEMSLADLQRALVAGQIDLALTYDLGDRHSDLTMTPLKEIDLRVYVAADHPLAGQGRVRLTDLRAEPYVLLDGAGSRDYFESVFASLGLTPEIAYRSTSLETVRSAVAAGLGITFLAMQPPSMRTYDGGRLAALELDPRADRLRIALARRTDHLTGKVTAAFANYAERFFAKA